MTLDASLEGAPEDLKLADAPALRRQVWKPLCKHQSYPLPHRDTGGVEGGFGGGVED